MVTRLLAASVCLISALAFAEKSDADAFLARHDSRPFVDVRGLSPVAQTAWNVSQVTSTEPRSERRSGDMLESILNSSGFAARCILGLGKSG